MSQAATRLLQDGGGTGTPKWWVVHTKSRQEKVLAADLVEREIDVFLPLVKTVRYYGRRKCRVELPLFPGYLFLRGTPQESFVADRTGRVAGLIKVADQAGLDAELSQIRLALDRGAVLSSGPAIATGTLVEVTSGPFKGIQGVVERGVEKDRLLLQVEIINRAAVLEVDRAFLTALSRGDGKADLGSGRTVG